MALLSTNNIKTGITSTAMPEVTLSAAANESFIVRDVYVDGTAGGYVTFFIDTSTQGFFRTDSTVLGNHLPVPPVNSKMKTLLGVLGEKGLFTGYPIPTGSKFSVRTNTPAAAPRITIVYDRYEAGDIKSDMENGKDAKSLVYAHYGTIAAVPAAGAAVDVPLTVRVNPGEFPDFPFRAGVSTKRVVTLYGIVFSTRARFVDAANNYGTNYLKLIKDRDVLFDPDRLGLISWASIPTVAGFAAETGHGVGGENSHLYQRDAFFLSKPMTFVEGEELDTWWTVRMTGTIALATLSRDLEICYILKETKI